ncbi:MAG: M23 family metallopeptidase [Candidatus Moranbacteria bacterium]|nr:M23 family metallopeptidase [Candidatus Moranbacteria bacterium]
MREIPKSIPILLTVMFLLFTAAVVLFGKPSEPTVPNQTPVSPGSTSNVRMNGLSESDQVSSVTSESGDGSNFVPPFALANERVTKKPFGIFITKAASPVQPERFSGYHTGTDFEVFPDETDTDVGVSAICDGTLLMKRSASGYGGVAVQSCAYDGRPITVVYGHLRLSSIRVKVGEPIAAGDFLGNLGAGYSLETDGERKHLHLGIHRGDIVDIRGYVTTVRQMSDWMDPYELIHSQQ